MKTAGYWIKHLQLKPHPEGGYYKEIYRSKDIVEKDHLDIRFNGRRSISTSIYFLMSENNFSKFHRIKSDETWHFYDGNPVIIYVLNEKEQALTRFILGKEIEKGQQPQLTIPYNSWFAAKILDESGFALVGCTVAPGFEFEDFEMGKRKELISLFPEYREIINKLSTNK